jgi:hypothetical protein
MKKTNRSRNPKHANDDSPAVRLAWNCGPVVAAYESWEARVDRLHSHCVFG